MSEKIVYVQCNLNLRQDVLDLIDGEREIRNNGKRGRSLTANQIILEYFDMRTPKGIKVIAQGGKVALSVEEEE
jgi:hypothetical protein